MTKLLSLPLAGRLTALRLENRREVFDSAINARSVLVDLGIQLGELVAGRLAVRGHSGYVFRWGEGWFEEVRDGGLGWAFQKEDRPAIDSRVQILLELYKPDRVSPN